MSSQQVTTFVYDASGREIEKWLDNETRSVTAYDAAGQPLVVSNLESDNSVISRFTYTYDPIGNRLQEVRNEGATTLRVRTGPDEPSRDPNCPEPTVTYDNHKRQKIRKVTTWG